MTDSLSDLAESQADAIAKAGELLADAAPDHETDVDRLAYRPALVRFVDDAADELEQFRDNGYRNRRDLLGGLHRLIFYSMGRIPDEWYREVATSNTLLSVLITGDERDRWNRHAIPASAATKERRRLAAVYVRPAMHAAFRELRKEADEYTADDELVDPDDLTHFAARPILDELLARQRRVLAKFIGGFDGRADLDRWLDRLDLATYSEQSAVTETIDYELTCNRIEEQVLFDELEHAAREREHQAAQWLLPAFNRTIPVVLARAGELPQEPETDDLEAIQI